MPSTCRLTCWTTSRPVQCLFTIDQQQYLQGYISVVALFLAATNQNTLGGGLPINTGPGFVTTDNADAVSALVDAGTR